ncbi:hypothetical protein [Luteolibacter soli]|uniref:hypothetical protein n=1 Tax=Luteolibacter soli TaxID=3135280 RepID=UPI00311A523E
MKILRGELWSRRSTARYMGNQKVSFNIFPEMKGNDFATNALNGNGKRVMAGFLESKIENDSQRPMALRRPGAVPQISVWHDPEVPPVAKNREGFMGE